MAGGVGVQVQGVAEMVFFLQQVQAVPVEAGVLVTVQAVVLATVFGGQAPDFIFMLDVFKEDRMKARGQSARFFKFIQNNIRKQNFFSYIDEPKGNYFLQIWVF